MMDLAWIVETIVYLYEGYQWVLTFADKRVQEWPFMNSPVATAAWTSLYLVVSYYGPRTTRSWPVLQLRWTLVVYNSLMVAFNLYILIEALTVALVSSYDFTCQPVDYSNDPLPLRMASVLWWFYISKLVEFCDTLFFILRKKHNQLTFLHVYHHSTMFCFWWIGIKWVAGGSTFMGAVLNSFVHILMYAYYAMAAALPTKDFWWKRYLTVIQMVQFNVAIVLTIRGLRIDCPFPRWMGYTLIGYMISFIVLFGNFWLQSYAKGRRRTAEMDTGKSALYDAVLPRKREVNGAISDHKGDGWRHIRGRRFNGLISINGTTRRRDKVCNQHQS